MKSQITDYAKVTLRNPILLIIIFTIIGVSFLYLYRNNENVIDYFLTIVGIGISTAVVQCALIQNRIQKDNIKIQLFDKRYTIFQTVLDSITIIKRDNWDRYILFIDNDISKQMIQIEENLYKSVHLAICVFDKDLHTKLALVNNAFCKVTNSYKEMLITNAKNISQEDIQTLKVMITSNLLSQPGVNSSEFYEILKKEFPKIYISIMNFSKECNAYISFIDKCKIISDFDKYIIVDKLEK